MTTTRVLFSLLFFFCLFRSEAGEIIPAGVQDRVSFSIDSAASFSDEQSGGIVLTEKAGSGCSQEQNPNKIIKKIRENIKKRKKIISACLAFPVPFGFFGLHRIYLGTKPYVPIIYVGTLGGAFGILPFIDFVVILLDKDITRFEKNDKVFMWVK